jgi:hypothetical protein
MADIALQHPGRVTILKEYGKWDEMAHRQRMLETARDFDHQATHIAMIDADEVLTADSMPIIRKDIEMLQPGVMLYASMFNMRGTHLTYHTNGVWGNRQLSIAFKDTPAAHWQGDTFHHREPHGVYWRHIQSPAKVMHLWGVTERRLIARHALYKVTEAQRWPNKPRASIDAQYNLAIKPRATDPEWTFATAPDKWWCAYSRLTRHMDLDRVPWQEAEVRRMLAADPSLADGLDLFGVEK